MQSSRVKKISIIGFVCLIAYWLYPSEYETLMKPIKKIKEEEKRLGKESPTFDGYVEPDFPNARENNKTLEGIDANGDGVRDDIEIWINRNAEDKYVRFSQKKFYINLFSFLKSINENKSADEVRSKLEELSKISLCATVLLMPYDKKYLNKYEINAGQFYYSQMTDVLVPNTSNRSKLFADWTRRDLLPPRSGGKREYCASSDFGARYIEIVKKNQHKGEGRK